MKNLWASLLGIALRLITAWWYKAAKGACSALLLLLLASICPRSGGSSRAALHRLLPNEGKSSLAAQQL